MGIRSFIAINLPESLLDLVQRIQKDFRKMGFSFRWVKPDQVHITLKFMADLAADDQGAIQEALIETAAQSAPFALMLQGCGVFPNLRAPRVLWLGMAGAIDDLCLLQKRLDQSISQKTHNRITMDDRPFRAHLTIARIKGSVDANHLLAALKSHAGVQSEPFSVSELHWIESRLNPTGPIYQDLSTISLGAIASEP
jgi:2'-5' RNA ligase